MSIAWERQLPLRKTYAERPEEAMTRKFARTSSAATPAGDPFHGEVEVGDGYGVSLRFGLDRYVGGLHDLPNPGDLLCAALAACQDATIRMAANLLAIELEELSVEVEGELDVRGTLAIDPDVRVGFEALRCRARLRPAAGTDPRRVERMLAAAERACVNADSLRGGIELTLESEIATEDEAARAGAGQGAGNR